MILLRSFAFNLMMYLTGAALSLRAHAQKRADPPIVLRLGMLWARVSLAALRRICGISYSVAGQDHLPAAGPALIAAQHQSAFDTLVWLALLPFPTYVLKHELLRLPLLGPLLVPSGFIPVDREAGALALRKMLADAKRASAEGRQIVIFPEGTRVPPGERAALQPGVVALAKVLDLPILPAATNSGLFWPRKSFRKTPGLVKIKIFPPLPAGDDRETILANLRRCFYDEGVDNSVDGLAPDFARDLNRIP
jgi:1-acyl-sn-glycerol-3-phosphate acyltransferase